MRRGRALRVEAPLGRAEVEARDAEVVDRLLLPRRQVASDVGDCTGVSVPGTKRWVMRAISRSRSSPGSTVSSRSAAAAGS
ncbi:hypothetical protein ACFQU2_38340 [Siccirubricoccus deserti]